MSMPTLIYILYILGAIVIILLIWVVITERRLKKFFAGTKAQNFEALIKDLHAQVIESRDSQKEINTHLITVEERLGKAIRKVETVRFNPFVEAGGNQSFAISFINDEGDGVILSSLYARDRMSIFAKPITDGKSEFELTAEEKAVLKKSK